MWKLSDPGGLARQKDQIIVRVPGPPVQWLAQYFRSKMTYNITIPDLIVIMIIFY